MRCMMVGFCMTACICAICDWTAGSDICASNASIRARVYVTCTIEWV